MLRRKKIKSTRGALYYSKHKPGLQLRHSSFKKVSNALYTISTFLVLTVGLTVFFSTITDGVTVSSPDKTTPLVTADNKTGSTPPQGVLAQKNETKKQATQGTASLNIASSASIQPKPAWLNFPLYTDPTNSASQYAATNPTAEGVSYIRRMGKNPVAEWFGDWNVNVQNDVNRYVSTAEAAGAVPIVVLYNIPLRDCGGYSIGGASGVPAYIQWVQKVVAGIGNRTAVVIVEPDALAALDCLPVAAQQDRVQSISQAVELLKSLPKTSVYIDAGTPIWQPSKTMAARLKQVNVSKADGFSLNISYFAPTNQNRQYGDALSSLVGYKHYVVDTSRNGGNNSVTGMQCNPSFASLGESPTTNTGSALNDALLWIKIPWESDGACNGSPDAGVGFWSYAVQLAQRAGW